MGRRLIASLIIIAMSMTLLAGCSKSGNEETNTGTNTNTNTKSEEEVILAFVGPQTGDNAEYGKSMKAAAQIAIDEWNEKGGVVGRKIKLIDYDDANSSEQAASIAEKIVGDKDIKAVLGHFSSGVAMTASEVYQEAGIALINGSAAHIDFAKIGDCIFRNNAIYTTDANTMLQVMDYLGIEKFGIINPNSDAGLSITNAIEGMVEKYGDKYKPELIISELYEDGTVDFSAAIAKFEQAGVQAIYSSGAYAQTAPFIQQYKAKHDNVQFVMSAACFSQEFLNLAGEASQDVIIPTSFFYGSEDDKVKAFSDKFTDVYGSKPSTFAAQIYDGTYAILYAMEKGNSVERADIVKNLATTDFAGVTGKITFDAEGNCPKQQVLLEIKDLTYMEIPGVLKSQTDWEKDMGLN